MSVSSGSDVTIRVQDSPPPPPSPYGNRIEQGKNGGLDNVAFEPDNNENEKKNHDNHIKGSMDNKKGEHTKIMMNGQNEQDPPLLNEALNSELINMNIMNTIPDKPRTEFGPYENPDEYFIAVNQHKKFLRRSEKLYVTKDKRKGNPWKKYVCWFLGAFILATIVTVAVLAGLGLISQKTTNAFTESVLGTTSSAGLSSSSLNPMLTTSTTDSNDLNPDDWISASASTTSKTTIDDFSSSPQSPPRPSLSDNYVPAAADVTITLSNAEYTAALNNKSSDKFHELSTEIEEEMRNVLRNVAGLTTAHVKVMEFLPGSVVVKMRVSWMDQHKELMEVQMFMSSLRRLNNYEIPPGSTSTYGLVNHCKFGNYGCSHHCTFDYEQLDFICTCPEYLLLSDDKKQCLENMTLTSSTAESTIDSVPEISETSERHDDHQHEVFTEPPFVATTEHVDDHHHMATPSPPTPIVTDEPVVTTESSPVSQEPGLPPISLTTENSLTELNETQAHEETNVDHSHGVSESTTEEEIHGRQRIIPIVPVTTQSPEETNTENVDQEQQQQNSSRQPDNEGEIGQTKAPLDLQDVGEESESAGGETPTEESINETTIPSTSLEPNMTVVSDEESNSNDALLQRTETDNYSEVEQHQHIVARINTTTTGAPIVSFNSSRYSEENNASTLLSQEASLSDESPLIEQHNLERIVIGGNSSVERDAELISGDLVHGNNTRSKSARFESFGEDQQTVPLFHSQFINATARRVLTNSAEFMVYGDNILGENPNQGGTDSGLTESIHQSRFNLDLNGTETIEGNNSSREGNVTESEISHNNSGSIEVVSNESLSGSSSTSPREDESASLADSDEHRASIVFSGIGQKLLKDQESGREKSTPQHFQSIRK